MRLRWTDLEGGACQRNVFDLLAAPTFLKVRNKDMTMRKSFDCVARCKRKLLISQKMTAKERLNVSAFPFLAFIF